MDLCNSWYGLIYLYNGLQLFETVLLGYLTFKHYHDENEITSVYFMPISALRYIVPTKINGGGSQISRQKKHRVSQ